MKKIFESDEIIISNEYKIFLDELESKISEYIYRTINNDLSYSRWADLEIEEFDLLEDITYEDILKRINKW